MKGEEREEEEGKEGQEENRGCIPGRRVEWRPDEEEKKDRWRSKRRRKMGRRKFEEDRIKRGLKRKTIGDRKPLAVT